MTLEEAKKIFLNRGYIEVPGGMYYDADKWRDAIVVISKWLEQEPYEDCISRQAAIDAMIKLEQDDIKQYGCSIPEGFNSTPAIEALKGLLPVIPKEKIGKWIDSKDWKERHFDSINFKKHCSLCNGTGYIQDKFCHECGARMIASQENGGD